MNLNEKIEVLREQLNYMLLNECSPSKDKVVNLSKELDNLINEYYLYEDKIHCNNN